MSAAGDRAVRERLEWERRWAERDARRVARRVPFRDRVFRWIGLAIVVASCAVVAVCILVLGAVAVQHV